jgi:hypothetical protein
VAAWFSAVAPAFLAAPLVALVCVSDETISAQKFKENQSG